jgi:hypothetical protein
MAANKEITRLPPYFPTFPSECQQPASTFFECFETKAVMKHESDTQSAGEALRGCQMELRQYMKCYEDTTAKMSSAKKKLLGLF